MAKLTRYLQKIFANNSNQVGVFGTGVDKVTSKNVETLQSADYEEGWSSAIITNKNYPIWQEMDGVQYGLSYQLKYLFQNGIPEWLSTETYYTNSYCRYGSDVYYSLQDDNTNHNPALNDGWWTPLLTSSRNIGEVVTSTIPLSDAGLHLLDGTLLQYGSDKAFIDYMADLYDTDPTANYFAQASTSSAYVQPTNPTGITATTGWSNVSNAFDNNSSTYATVSNYTGYIEWDFGQTLSLTGISVNASWASAASHYTDFKLYSVNAQGTETEIATTTGREATASYYSTATFTAIETNKIRIRAYDPEGYVVNYPTRVIQIDITADTLAQTAEEWWQNQVSTYGVCGKFVYDSVNNTVRLPKYGNQIYTKDIASTAPAKGNGIAIGFTNGTTNAGLRSGSDWYANPASYGASVSTSYVNNNQLTGTIGLTTDGTKSGIITDLSDITTSLDDYYYIVVATSVKTDIQKNIDEIATDLNGKADVDLSNINASASAKNTIIGWGMPDYSAGVSKTVNTVYTASVDCFVSVYTLYSNAIGGAGLYVYDANDNMLLQQVNMGPNTSGSNSSVNAFVPKGYKYKATNVSQTITITEYPLKGAS